jgi:hypothetical protein
LKTKNVRNERTRTSSSPESTRRRTKTINSRLSGRARFAGRRRQGRGRGR